MGLYADLEALKKMKGLSSILYHGMEVEKEYRDGGRLLVYKETRYRDK
jgi:hypothetical protein